MRFALWFVSVLALTSTPAASAGSGFPVWSLQTGWHATAPDAGSHGNGVLGDAAASARGSFRPVFTLHGTLTRLAAPDNSSLEPPSGVSVSVYLKGRGSPGPYRYLIAKGAAGCIVAASYALYTGPSGGLMFYVSQNDGLSYARSPDAGSAIWDGRSHLAVGTYDGTAVHLYVDGREVGAGTRLTGPIGYGLVGSNDIFFGHLGACPNTHFSGSISELAIWRRALTRLEAARAHAARVARDRSSNPPAGFGGA
jgi:hypothetical protein